MGTSITVPESPDCDFCKEDGEKTPAIVDGKTRMGPWANMCEKHYLRHGIGLGTGKGQLLIPLKEAE